MNYLVVYSEDSIKGFEEIEEVESFKEELTSSQMDEYCDEYDIDIDDISQERVQEIGFACGYENGEIKTYEVSELIDTIKLINIDNEEKIYLKKVLKGKCIIGDVNDYEGLEEVLELANEMYTYY